MDDLEKILKVAEAQTKRFPNGNDPFKIVSRLLEESGEVAWELNHYDRKGISLECKNKDGKREIMCEMYQVMISLCHLLQYYDLQNDFRDRIDEVYKEYMEKNLLVK